MFWLFYPQSRCFGSKQYILGIAPPFYETNISSNWQIGYFSLEDSILTTHLSCDLGLNLWYRWRYHPNIRWQRYWVFLPGSCWCNSGSLFGHWIIQMVSPGTQNCHIWFEKASFTHYLLWFSCNGRHLSSLIGWTFWLSLDGSMIHWWGVIDIGFQWLDYLDLDSPYSNKNCRLASYQIV